MSHAAMRSALAVVFSHRELIAGTTILVSRCDASAVPNIHICEIRQGVSWIESGLGPTHGEYLPCSVLDDANLHPIQTQDIAMG